MSCTGVYIVVVVVLVVDDDDDDVSLLPCVVKGVAVAAGVTGL